MPILDKERLRANLDEVIWNIEEARITVSEHHIVKLVIVANILNNQNCFLRPIIFQRCFCTHNFIRFRRSYEYYKIGLQFNGL